MTRIRAAAIIVFVALACGLAWVVALPLWLGDGLAEPSTWFLLPVMMLTPAIAALVVTFTMRIPSRGERARFLGLWPLRPAKRVVWLMVAGWLVPPLLVALGIVLAAGLGFVQLDLTFAAFSAEVAKALPAGAPMPPIEVVVISQIVMIPFGALLNSVLAFGEELGWRGWLVPALRPLGTWPTLLLSGAIWGVWHSPLILLGYNFGRTDITGVLFMIGGCHGLGCSPGLAAPALRLGLAGCARPWLPQRRRRADRHLRRIAARSRARRTARPRGVDRRGSGHRRPRRHRAVP